MLFDQPVVSEYGAKERGYGFRILRDSLFLSCAQEIAKICFDGDDRTPSIKTIVETVDNKALQEKLSDAFSGWKYPQAKKEQSPEVIAAIKRMELREQSERKVQFEELVTELNTLWKGLNESKLLEAYRTIRDKITAHSEVRYVADKYSFVDIGELGLKWDDMKGVLPRIQRMIEILGLIVRNSGFAWELLDEQLGNAATDFWVVSEGAR